MVKFISAITGKPMWVHESRVVEYRAAGHKLAAPPPKPKPRKNSEKVAKK